MASRTLHPSSSRSAPLLQSQSFDKLDAQFQAQPPMAAPHVARPRPEIILRWKRFALLVLLSAVLISALTATLWVGIPLSVEGESDEAERKTELYNSYIGVAMGFAESVVGELLRYLFPVFIVYLHNLKWSKMDDPGTRPISKGKKVALLLFFPIVMIAIGNSLSAVQTNTEGDEGGSSGRRRLTAETVSRLDQTPLKSVVRGYMQPMADAEASLKTSSLGLERVAAATRVAVAFPVHDWATELLPTQQDLTAAESLTLTLSDRSNELKMKRAAEIVTVSTAAELLRHGVAMYSQVMKEAGVVTQSTTSSLTQASAMEDVVTMASTAFNSSDIQLTLQRRQLHQDIQLELLSVSVPLPGVQAVDTQCGKESCVSFSADPRARLRSLVAASQFTPSCQREGLSECAAEPNSAFLYGSSLSASGDGSYSLKLTFAKLTWAFNSAELCDDASTHAAACNTLSFELPHSRRHLVLNALLAPTAQLADASRSMRLMQVIQPPVVVANQLAAVASFPATSQSFGIAEEADRFGSFLRANSLVLAEADTMAQTLDAASLLFLFQHAIVTPSAATATLAWQRHLKQAADAIEYQVYVANTRFGAIATWTACGILFTLSTLVLVFPNARARLEPPKGGNARAERFIAVQTEEVYPNLIYKKRFRIGKTGEKIKFREFAVDAVTLHHKMEEDEQIYL